VLSSGVRLNIEGLRRRLKDLGVNIPERTLRDWASKGFIPRPTLATRKTRRKLGFPVGYRSKGERNEIVVRGAPGRRYKWPEEAVFEAAACRALKPPNPRGQPASEKTIKRVSDETIKRVKMLVYKFFENAAAVEYREDYNPDGTKTTVFSDYGIDPLFRIYLVTYEKALNKVPLTERVKIIYYYVPLNCSKNGQFISYIKKIVHVSLEHVSENRDFLELKRIEPWEYIDPDTRKPYKIVRDENGCQKFVKDLPNGERFLKYNGKL
jgi:hypothetical protein